MNEISYREEIHTVTVTVETDDGSGNIIETQFLTTGDWNFGSAISLIMAVIIMISMWLTRKADVQVASQGKE